MDAVLPAMTMDEVENPCCQQLHQRVSSVQFSLFLYPDQVQNTSSEMQRQEATVVAVILVTPPQIHAKQQNTNETP